MKCWKTNSQVIADLAIIVGAWIMLLTAFLVLGRAGYGTGLMISPMGEDQNWIALLQDGTAGTIANNFWKIDGRNPLSPWFYIAARPLILRIANGLALLQYAAGLSLGLATYALLRLLAGRGGRWLAVFTTVIVVVNQANAYFDHIIWSFQLALCFSIASIVFYVLFLRTERRWILAYGISLCFWCLSFYSYTLQSGAVVAIVACQITYIGVIGWRTHLTSGGLSIQQIKGRIPILFDIVPYVVTFIIFLLTWITAVPPGGGFPYVFSFARLISSLQAGIFHQDIILMFQVTKLSHFAAWYAVIGLLLAASLTGLICRVVPRSKEPGACRYFFIALVVVSIALPTLLVESGGADWPPGSRWRMIYQMTTPVLMLSITGFVLASFPTRFNQPILTIAAFAILVTSLVFSLAYNERQVSLTNSERVVREAMREAIAERSTESNAGPLFVLLEVDDTFQWLPYESLRRSYMKSWFPGANVEYRILASSGYLPSNPTRLAFKPQGIVAVGDSTEFPYDRVVLLQASGKSVSRSYRISRQEVISHYGDWQVSRDTIDLKK